MFTPFHQFIVIFLKKKKYHWFNWQAGVFSVLVIFLPPTPRNGNLRLPHEANSNNYLCLEVVCTIFTNNRILFSVYLGHAGHVEQRFLPETDSSLQPRNYQTMRGQGAYDHILEFHP